MFRTSVLSLFRFFSGFCLISNGIYIAFILANEILDTAVMLAHGTPRWQMVTFGLVTISFGLFLWHDQGNHFGIGESNGKVDKRAVVISVCLLVAIIMTEILFSFNQESPLGK